MNNPFMDLSPAEIDVLDDMLEEWNDKDRHNELNGSWGYGPKKTDALSNLTKLVRDAWCVKVRYGDIEEMDD